MSKRINFSDIEIEVLADLVDALVGKNAKWVDSVISSEFKARLLKKLTPNPTNQDSKGEL